MKKLIYLLIVFAFVGCYSDKSVKTAIADYIQTNSDGIKTDYQIKFKSLKLDSTITAMDTLKWEYKGAVTLDEIKIANDSLINSLENDIKKGEHELDSLKTAVEIEPDYLRYITLDYISKKEETIERFKDILEDVKIKRELIKTPDKILAYIFEAHISYVNPLLNNAKQETTKKYLLNAEKNKVIRIIEDPEK
jgi:hypothetical protein